MDGQRWIYQKDKIWAELSKTKGSMKRLSTELLEIGGKGKNARGVTWIALEETELR